MDQSALGEMILDLYFYIQYNMRIHTQKLNQLGLNFLERLSWYSKKNMVLIDLSLSSSQMINFCILYLSYGLQIIQSDYNLFHTFRATEDFSSS